MERLELIKKLANQTKLTLVKNEVSKLEALEEFALESSEEDMITEVSEVILDLELEAA